MKRFLLRVLAGFLTGAAVLVAMPVSLGTEGATFVDAAPGDWFAPYVEVCVREGLMEGVGEGKFEPGRVLSVEEALVLAARLTWRADGGTGDLPAGGTAEEFHALVHPDDGPTAFGYELDTYKEMAGRWSWDGVFYITKRFREVYGPGTTYWYDLDAAAKREEFFALLGLSVKVLDLPQLNEVDQLPDVDRDGDVHGAYRLCEAGIVTGVDEYGSAAPGGSLTRAEAAAMAARVLEPELRVTGWSPAPLPTDGYTLTYLMDGTVWLNYPLAFVEYTNETGEYANCFLTLDGERLDWPEGTDEGVPSFGLEQRGEYVWMMPWDRSEGNYYGTKVGLMDGNGKMVIPFGRYKDVWPTGDGHFIRTVEAVSETEYSKTDVFLLSADGTVEAQLPSVYGTPDNDWRDFNEGVCPWLDEDSGLWGYVDVAGDWVVEPIFSWAEKFRNGYAVVVDREDRMGLMDRQGEMVIPFGDYDTLRPFENSPDYDGPEGLVWFSGPDGSGWMDLDGNRYPAGAMNGENGGFRNGYCSNMGVYYDVNRKPVSQKFDVTGQIGPDGRGFVGLDGKIYRIQFTAAQTEEPSLSKPDAAFVPFQEGDRYGLKDADGNVVIPAQYDYLVLETDGAVVVTDRKGNKGILDTEGNVVLPCLYPRIYNSPDELGLVVVGTAGDYASPLHYNGKKGMIDRQGTIIIPLEYDFLTPFEGGQASFMRGDVFGHLLPDGTEVVLTAQEVPKDDLLYPLLAMYGLIQ